MRMVMGKGIGVHLVGNSKALALVLLVPHQHKHYRCGLLKDVLLLSMSYMEIMKRMIMFKAQQELYGNVSLVS